MDCGFAGPGSIGKAIETQLFKSFAKSLDTISMKTDLLSGLDISEPVTCEKNSATSRRNALFQSFPGK